MNLRDLAGCVSAHRQLARICRLPKLGCCLLSARHLNACQWPVGSPRGRPVIVPAGGQLVFPNGGQLFPHQGQRSGFTP
ncbi:hypothetical protein, partial [Nocardia farcinica]|uniref:hypothetical protein n=1 Tax=Nocardia farcinica TaxID=37329 RepID=UPI001E5977AA